MTQIPILAGVYTKDTPDVGASYPLNFVPIVEKSGVSNGYLRCAEGVSTFATGLGQDRGGIVWNGTMYRALGSYLATVSESGVVTSVGAIAGSGLVSMAYSFDKLAVASGLRLYLLTGGTLAQVTDADLGDVIDMVWMDGYFITTDGTHIVVTELNDPTAVDPLKYGSSEDDPDSINGLLKIRGELYVLNRHTIEVFQNVGQTGFPFQRARGAQIPKGAVGTHAKCMFVETFAFCGSGRDESPRIYLAGSGQAVGISNRELDDALDALTDTELAGVVLESRQGFGRIELFVHLPTETFVYNYSASQLLDLPVWYRLGSGGAYRPRNYTHLNGKWYCGDAGSGLLGLFNADVSTQFGDMVQGYFDTPILYGEGRGAIIHELELQAQAGFMAFGDTGTVLVSFSDDGVHFGQERAASYGPAGGRSTRVVWHGCGMFRNTRIARFRVMNTAPCAFRRLEARIEGLNA